MASATQVPPTMPPVRPPRPPRSLAGPVVLIVIGIFFLLGNMHVLYWHDLGAWFAHFWPVLLIGAVTAGSPAQSAAQPKSGDCSLTPIPPPA